MESSPKGTLSPTSVNVPPICTINNNSNKPLPSKRKRKRDRAICDGQKRNNKTPNKPKKKIKKSKKIKKVMEATIQNEGQKKKRRKKPLAMQRKKRECGDDDHHHNKKTQDLISRICTLEQMVKRDCPAADATITTTITPSPPVPVVDNTLASTTTATVDKLQAEMLRLTRFNQLQTKRNNINVNLFAVILNELSLKLNMKGRLKEDRSDDSLPLSIGRICSLKCDSYDQDPEVGWQPQQQQGGGNDGSGDGEEDTNDSQIKESVEHAQLSAVLEDVSTRVLEAAAISISGQTVTSIDDKNTHRIKQIREFKLANGIPINGLVCFKKNVTRFNQDAGLACNMTLGACMENGMHVCFGNDAERMSVHYAQMLNDNDMDMNVDMDALCGSGSDHHHQYVGENVHSDASPTASSNVTLLASDDVTQLVNATDDMDL